MRRMGVLHSRVATSALLLALIGLLVACSTDAPKGPDAPHNWVTSTDPVSTQGLAWASGSTVRLGDGSTIDTGAEIVSFVVAGDGVYFVGSDGSDDTADSPSWGDLGELRYADRDGRVVDTGLTVDAAASLRASPDGR